ncbi:hypothetical protein HU200_033294 [Digitaria exilis]|uniref:F-box domain-containing protein n=1 Tax=Digitaria exilis TaxID=1010633 RepID=A0A835BXM3_9POAL|nr:hypothetical protein HU200_033294 [Digitaria exilis]
MDGEKEAISFSWSVMESRRNTRVVATATSHGVLPLDVVFDVLVCLPAKDICRLRAICRPWRSLTSDPAFIKAHAARHPEPLIVAQRKRDLVHVMDLSGGVIKRVPIPRWQTLMCSHLGLICVGDCDTSRSYHDTSRSCYLIDPATKVSCRLDVNCFEDRLCTSYGDHDECLDPAFSLFALGRVDSTGVYKVLMVSCFTYAELNEDQQSYHVLTVNGAGGGTRWRSTASPEFLIGMDTMNRGVVLGGAVYYLADDSEFHTQALQTDNTPDLIALSTSRQSIGVLSRSLS